MAQDPSDLVLGAVVLVLAIASVGTWFALADRFKQGPLLRYELRRPVPWHGIWTLLPILLVALTVFAAMGGADTADDDAATSAHDLVDRLALGSAQQTAFVVAFLAVVIAVSHATRADLGLPKSVRELVRDIWIGIVAWLAALAPVYGMQYALLSVFGPAKGHPLIKIVQEQADPTLFALAFAAAVVVAPICEELMFRLLLQGWLEKWEDFQLGWRTPVVLLPIEVVEDAEVADSDATVTEESLPVVPTLAVAEIAVPAEPPRIGVGGLPYGWLPIVLSSLLFALAHVGYGPDPVPLFLLALILGYVYQRTHRIVPSMVAHALFNGMSLFALWRVMSAVAP
ncbi:MAG: CPBP family intramembrane glutamic endopeptidase [Pirellulales bacterium]